MKKSDCKLCVDILRNKAEPPNDRLAAAESLMYCSSYVPTKTVLFQTMCDETEEDWLREECAGSLGTVFTEIGVDYDMFLTIPDAYIRELVTDFEMEGIKIEESCLGAKAERIRELIGDLVEIA